MTQAQSHRQSVELFHLLVLDQLGRKLDKQSCVLKGGCNFRFFFKSPRYSEDMDLDVEGVAAHALRDAMQSILEARPFQEILEVRDLAIEHVTLSKQTETTQRWKLGLSVPHAALPLPTKIEFSRRGLSGDFAFASIDPLVIREHQLSPILCNHYTATAACGQKVQALLSRSVPQARDVFDLYLLVSSNTPEREWLDASLLQQREEIQTRMLDVDFALFKSQVLAYLPPASQERYDDASLWDTMVLEVLKALFGDEA